MGDFGEDLEKSLNRLEMTPHGRGFRFHTRPETDIVALIISVVFGLFLLAAVLPHRQVQQLSRKSSPAQLISRTDFELPPSTVIFDDFNGSSVADASGITYAKAYELNSKYAAIFSRAAASRIEYRDGVPREGTLEWWVNIRSGYSYHDFHLSTEQDHAIIFGTDSNGGDVTWPGTTTLAVAANGDISLFMATNKYNKPSAEPLQAKSTTFKFGEWHALGITYGTQGQSIMLDGKVVAFDSRRVQPLGAAGTQQQPVDVPTLGEAISGFWARHRYDGCSATIRNPG